MPCLNVYIHFPRRYSLICRCILSILKHRGFLLGRGQNAHEPWQHNWFKEEQAPQAVTLQYKILLLTNLLKTICYFFS